MEQNKKDEPIPVVNLPKQHKPSASSKILVLLIIVTALVAVSTMFVAVSGKKMLSDNLSTVSYDLDANQLVTMQNGDKFVGKLTSINQDYLVLEKAYSVSMVGGKVTTAKLSNGIYGTNDTVYISRDSVSYWETVKKNGAIDKSIYTTATNETTETNAVNQTAEAQNKTTDKTTTTSGSSSTDSSSNSTNTGN